MQNTAFSTNKTLNLRGKILDLSTPRVMGILNVTPDSFFDGGKFESEFAMLEHCEKMIKDGVDIIDVGGYSSRPGAEDISEAQEASRTLPAIRSIVKEFPETAISVDTFRSSIAKSAIDEGAAMVNDISGGTLDPMMFETVAQLNVPYVLMHMKGTPQTMNRESHYDNIIADLLSFFHSRLQTLTELGVKDVIVDPGFGFAKTVDQNFLLLRQLEKLQILQRPLMVGLSRKSMVWRTLDIKAADALNGSSALHAFSLMKGASILRVHDVKEALQVIKLFMSLGD